MLIIGAAGRNLGKTEFACELIRRHAATQPVFGIKVTTIEDQEGTCSRGGQGCGACTSLQGNYCISEELPTANKKDTDRMLRAGAKRVWWLRVLHEHLEAGLVDVLERIPADALVVCESNSARTVLEPGLFVIVRGSNSTAMKPSCRAVLCHADRVVEFHGQGWDFQPAQIVTIGHRWVLWPDATAVILAGGESLRMGLDKSLLEVGNQPMIGHIADQLACFPERLIGSNDPARYAFLHIPVIPDQVRGRGPLMGILSCVDRAAHELCFVTGCDIPMLDPGFILHLLAQADDYDIVMPQFADGRVEPLLAVYRKTVVPVAQAIVERGGRRIVELFDHLRVHFVSGDSLSWYHNLNTMGDLRRWMARGTPGSPDAT
jgi:molybdopterin-guanine dinucleotide biosynthesis protein A